MKILVTGAAGFIGSALSIRLLDRGDEVLGIDNHNDYYDPALKEARLARHINHENYSHIRMDIEDGKAVEVLFKEHQFEGVVNLAAQAGVRYSIENPLAYINTNMVGFGHILEGCRHSNVGHLVYASSSSVYGSNTKMPFSIHDNIDHPLSLYAASKKANELMAHAYSHLYDLPTTGLRFFTVYGEWGRPDMFIMKFLNAIFNKNPMILFNRGNHLRDFTYIDDIVDGLVKSSEHNFKAEFFELGKGVNYSINEVANMFGKDYPREYIHARKGEYDVTLADYSKAKLKLGWEPEGDIIQYIKCLIRNKSTLIL